ncbi:MAG: DHH family phosphoesterase [Candidatus Woesearchaeota archaeon]
MNEKLKKENNFLKKLEKYGIYSQTFKEELLNLKNVLENLSNSISILHDSDSDGLCSNILLKSSFSTIISSHFITKEFDSQKIAIEEIPSSATHILFLDTPSIDMNIVEELTKKYSLIILDHHKISPEILKIYTQKLNIEYINPLLHQTNNIYIIDSRPITFFSYILSNQEISHLLYSLIGTVSDFYITSIFQDLLEEENQTNSNLNKIQTLCNSVPLTTLQHISKTLNTNPLYYQTHLDENRDLVYMFSYSTHIGTLKLFFDFLFKNTSKSQEYIHLIEKFTIFELLGEIDEGSYPPFYDFKKYKLKYKKILQKEYKIFNNSQKDNQKDRILIEHKGKTSYNRQLSEQALYELDVKISCSIHKKYEREFFSGSIRSTGDVNLHTFLNQIFKGVEEQVKWGGHINACGFQFPFEFKEEFIRRFNSIIL